MRFLRLLSFCGLALLASCDSKDAASPLASPSGADTAAAEVPVAKAPTLSAADSAASQWLGRWTMVVDSIGGVPQVSGRVSLRFLTDTSGILVRHAWGDSAPFTYVGEVLSSVLVDRLNLFRTGDTLRLFSYLPTTHNAWVRNFSGMDFVRGLAPDTRRIAMLLPMDLSDTVTPKPAVPDTLYDTVITNPGTWTDSFAGPNPSKVPLIDYDTLKWLATDTALVGIWKQITRNGNPDTTSSFVFDRPDSLIIVDHYYGFATRGWYVRNSMQFSISCYLGNRPLRLLHDTLALGFDGIELRFLRRFKPTPSP